jgi:N-methylhydantoinase B
MIQNSMTGVQLAVLTARFEGIARKMANTLQRTGRSGILTIARDFSCVILTAKHELLTASDNCRSTCSAAPR